VPTWFRALHPGRFWRIVRMEHPVVLPRLASFVFLSALLAHLAVVATWVVLFYPQVWRRLWTGGWNPGWTGRLLQRCVWPYGFGDCHAALAGDLLEIDDYHVNTLLHWVFLAWMVATPLSFLILTDTFRQVRVRYVHLLRAAVYSSAPAPLLAALHAGVQIATTMALSSSLVSNLTVDTVSRVLRGSLWLAAGAWIVWYWWVVPKDYLRLPQARAVSIVMLGLSGFAAFVLGIVLMVTGLRR
jgi:hypothetical protein